MTEKHSFHNSWNMPNLKTLSMVALASCSLSTISAQISAGDVISIDFGNRDSSANVTNWNSLGGVDTGANFSLSLSNLVRISDGTDTGVSITVDGVDGFLNIGLEGSGSSVVTVYNDTIFAGVGAADDTLTFTIEGLDSLMSYDITGGFHSDNNANRHHWNVNGDTRSNSLEGGVLDGYETFTGVLSEDGVITFTITDLANRNSRAPIAELTLTAVAPTVDAFLAPVVEITSETDLEALRATLGTATITVEDIRSAYDDALQAQYGDSAGVTNVNDTLTVSTTTTAAATGAILDLQISDAVAGSADMTVTLGSVGDLESYQLTAIETAETIANAHGDQVDILDSDGELVDNIVVDDLSTLSNPTLIQGLSEGALTTMSTTNLMFNGAHHRNLLSKFNNENTIEWGTFDFNSNETSDATQYYGEAGVGSLFGTESFAGGLGIGYASISSDGSANSSFENSGVMLNGEVNKAFFENKLVFSGLLSAGVYKGQYSRQLTTAGTRTLPVIQTTFDSSVVDLVDTSDSSTVDSFNAEYNHLSTVTGTSDQAGVVTESYSGESSNTALSLRLRGDFEFFRNRDYAFTARASYTSGSMSYEEVEETGGLAPTTYDQFTVDHSSVRVGADFDWFINDKMDVRFLAESVTDTVDSVTMTSLNTENIAQTFTLPETESSYQRLGAELGLLMDDDVTVLQLMLGRTFGDLESTLYSMNVVTTF